MWQLAYFDCCSPFDSSNPLRVCRHMFLLARLFFLLWDSCVISTRSFYVLLYTKSWYEYLSVILAISVKPPPQREASPFTTAVRECIHTAFCGSVSYASMMRATSSALAAEFASLVSLGPPQGLPIFATAGCLVHLHTTYLPLQPVARTAAVPVPEPGTRVEDRSSADDSKMLTKSVRG